MTTFTGIYTGLTPNPLNLALGEQYTIEVHSVQDSMGMWRSAIFMPGSYPAKEGEKLIGMALETVEVLLAMFTEIVVGSSGLRRIIDPRNN